MSHKVKFSVKDMLKESHKQRDEQLAAQIAVLSCEMSSDVIQEAVRTTVLRSKRKPKTRYEYTVERVRDFKVNKKRGDEEEAEEDVFRKEMNLNSLLKKPRKKSTGTSAFISASVLVPLKLKELESIPLEQTKTKYQYTIERIRDFSLQKHTSFIHKKTKSEKKKTDTEEKNVIKMGIETSNEYFNNNNIYSLSGSSGVDLEKDMESLLDSLDLGEDDQFDDSISFFYILNVGSSEAYDSDDAVDKVVAVEVKQKTKYEYNKERVRNFQMNRKKVQKKNVVKLSPLKTTDVAKDLEKFGKATYAEVSDDSNTITPFLRDYSHVVLKDSLGIMDNIGVAHKFEYLQQLDLSFQLIGDDNFKKICKQIPKILMELKSLNISGNKLTDIGIQAFSTVYRSLHSITQLNMSNNMFSDRGLEFLILDHTYSSSLKVWDLSCNIFTPYTAYRLGATMFSTNRHVALDTLILGGRVNKFGWGDTFLKVLVNSLINENDGTGLKSLKGLYIPDFGISSEGVDAITALLSCDNAVIESLNISQNHIPSKSNTKRNFINSIRLNKTLRNVFVRQCGMTPLQIRLINESLVHNKFNYNNKPILSWLEKIGLAFQSGMSLNQCQIISRDVKIDAENDWNVKKIFPWRILPPNKDDGLIKSFEKTFKLSLSSLPQHVLKNLYCLEDQIFLYNQITDANHIIRLKTISPKPLLKFIRANVSKIKSFRLFFKAIEIIKLNETSLTLLEPLISIKVSNTMHARDVLFTMLNTYCTNKERYLMSLKLKKKKANKMTIKNEPSAAIDFERLQMSLEDFHSNIVEESELLQQVIGHFHIRSVLNEYMSPFLQNSSQSEVHNKLLLFDEFVSIEYPSFRNLMGTMMFVEYFYFHLWRVKEEMKKRDANIKRIDDVSSPMGYSSANTILNSPTKEVEKYPLVRFLQPKKEMQKKLNELTPKELSINKGFTALARSRRNRLLTVEMSEIKSLSEKYNKIAFSFELEFPRCESLMVSVSHVTSTNRSKLRLEERQARRNHFINVVRNIDINKFVD